MSLSFDNSVRDGWYRLKIKHNINIKKVWHQMIQRGQGRKGESVGGSLHCGDHGWALGNQLQ